MTEPDIYLERRGIPHGSCHLILTGLSRWRFHSPHCAGEATRDLQEPQPEWWRRMRKPWGHAPTRRPTSQSGRPPNPQGEATGNNSPQTTEDPPRAGTEQLGRKPSGPAARPGGQQVALREQLITLLPPKCLHFPAGLGNLPGSDFTAPVLSFSRRPRLRCL